MNEKNSDQNGGGSIPKPPRTFRRTVLWLGPGITWLAAGAGGAGELLFPPRIGSLYGYTFFWALVLAIVFKWFINREIGRFSVSTGASLLDGFRLLPGPGNWAVWIIMVPQLLVSISAIAGLASSAATALILMLPGSVLLWLGVILLSTMTFLLIGRYGLLEKVATILAILLAIAGIVAAITVFPGPGKLAAGLVPSLPSDADYQEVLPWLSFILAGAAGMIWYSYWVPAKGYGAAEVFERINRVRGKDEYSEQDVNRLRGWIREMTIDNTLGVIGGLFIVTAFLILGAELLGPEGIVPEKQRVAEVLGRMLENVWGRVGFWFMIVGVFLGFYNTTLTNQDGWGRLLGNGVKILGTGLSSQEHAWLDNRRLRKVFIVLISFGAFGLYALVGRPVGLLQIAGIIEAFQIPVVAALVLFLNHRFLPEPLRPRKLVLVGMAVAILFYLSFALFYILSKTGIIGGG